MDYQLVPLPNAVISKSYNKGYKQIFENYNIECTIRNQRIQIHINKNCNKVLPTLFINTSENCLAISKFYRYDTEAGKKPYFCLDTNGQYFPLFFEERSEHLLLYYLVQEAIYNYGIKLEKDKCCLCGHELTDMEKNHLSWQYCSDCWTKI